MAKVAIMIKTTITLMEVMSVMNVMILLLQLYFPTVTQSDSSGVDNVNFAS